MSRWPRGIDAAYLQHESEQRYARVEAVWEARRKKWARTRPLPAAIVDRDLGDEQQQPAEGEGEGT